MPPSKQATTWRRPWLAKVKLVWVHSVMAKVAFLLAETSCGIMFMPQKATFCHPYGEKSGLAAVYSWFHPSAGASVSWRKVHTFGVGRSSGLSWSPDGKFLAVSDRTSPEEPFALFLVSVESGEKERLTSPPAQSLGDYKPAFSPDGRTLAFVRQSAVVIGEIYLVQVAGGEPRRLTFNDQAIRGLAWTPDGREIVF